MPATFAPASSDTDTQIHLHPLRQILSQRSVVTHFQPIVSVKRKALIGVEALARANDPSTGKPVSPVQLFGWAREMGLMLELDQLCQQQALAAFASLPERDPALLLFMNVEASLLDQRPELSLLQAATQAGVDPASVVIEVNEAHVHDPARLQAFVARHREAGFLVAMDDLGSGQSSLQRWPLLRPDVIKLDRSLVDGVAGSYFTQELLRSIISLGRQTGALILAEGVESAADVTACLDLGVDLFQGYYFARPSGEPFTNLDQALERVISCSTHNKVRNLDLMDQRREAFAKQRSLAQDMAAVLSETEIADFGRLLRSLPWDRQIESLWVLNSDGLQCSPVVYNGAQPRLRRATLFQPPKVGTDHSDRDYYYALMEGGLGRDCFITDPHLSNASGAACRTLAHRFEHPNGERFIACLEIGAA